MWDKVCQLVADSEGDEDIRWHRGASAEETKRLIHSLVEQETDRRIAIWLRVRLGGAGPVLGLFLLGAARQIFHRDRRGGLLLAWALVPPLPFLVIAEVVYARYFLITIPAVALLAAPRSLL